MAELGPREKHLGMDEPITEPEETDLSSLAPPEAPEPVEERPEWLNPRYSSVEEQAKGQAESERRMQEALQAQADLEKRLAALEQQQPVDQGYENYEQPYYDPMQQASYEEQLRQLAEVDPLAAMRAVAAENAQAQYAQQQQMQAWQQWQAQQQAPLAQQRQETEAMMVANEARRNVTARHEDFNNYEDQVAELLSDDPEFIAGQHAWDLGKLERGLERAYMVAKAQDVLGREQELRDQGVAPEDLEHHRKMAAQTMRGASARPAEPSEEEKQLAEIANSGMQSYGAARRTLWGDMRAPTT